MKATLIGLLIALFGTVVGGLVKGVSPVYLMTNIPAIMIVVVGAMGATVASFEMKVTTNVFSAIMKAIFPKPLPDPSSAWSTTPPAPVTKASCRSSPTSPSSTIRSCAKPCSSPSTATTRIRWPM